MCHHIGDIPEEMPDWTTEDAEAEAEDEAELPEFLNEDTAEQSSASPRSQPHGEGEDVSVLTDGGDTQ